jgi:hypothetical protein
MPLGVPALGGIVTTGGGVAFLSGTLDYFLRAYDLRTGARLCQARLPAGGQATPMTYADSSGKQYVLVVAGGTRLTRHQTGRLRRRVQTAFAVKRSERHAADWTGRMQQKRPPVMVAVATATTATSHDPTNHGRLRHISVLPLARAHFP